MLWALLVGAAYFLSHRLSNGAFDTLTGREDIGRSSNPSVSRQRAPALIRDDLQEKSFASNRVNNTVRLPFGPNPHTKEVNAFEFINYPQYRARYRDELHRMTVENQHWRFDAPFNSSLVNMQQVHMAEDYPKLISISASGNSQTPEQVFEQRR